MPLCYMSWEADKSTNSFQQTTNQQTHFNKLISTNNKFNCYLRVLRVLRGIYVWGVGGRSPRLWKMGGTGGETPRMWIC